MMQGENAVIDDKSCQHDDTEEIDEIKLEATDGGQPKPPEDGGEARREDEKKPQWRTYDRDEAKQKDRYDNDDDSAYFGADVLRDGELEGIGGEKGGIWKLR